MWKRCELRLVISSWVLALAVSVVPVGGVNGDPFGDPIPINEQTNPDPNGAPGLCVECQRD